MKLTSKTDGMRQELALKSGIGSLFSFLAWFIIAFLFLGQIEKPETFTSEALSWNIIWISIGGVAAFQAYKALRHYIGCWKFQLDNGTIEINDCLSVKWKGNKEYLLTGREVLFVRRYEFIAKDRWGQLHPSYQLVTWELHSSSESPFPPSPNTVLLALDRVDPDFFHKFTDLLSALTGWKVKTQVIHQPITRFISAKELGEQTEPPPLFYKGKPAAILLLAVLLSIAVSLLVIASPPQYLDYLFYLQGVTILTVLGTSLVFVSDLLPPYSEAMYAKGYLLTRSMKYGTFLFYLFVVGLEDLFLKFSTDARGKELPLDFDDYPTQVLSWIFLFVILVLVFFFGSVIRNGRRQRLNANLVLLIPSESHPS